MYDGSLSSNSWFGPSWESALLKYIKPKGRILSSLMGKLVSLYAHKASSAQKSNGVSTTPHERKRMPMMRVALTPTMNNTEAVFLIVGRAERLIEF
jgi:hypothetical protein